MVREGKEKGDVIMDRFGLQPYNQRKNTFGPPAQLYLPPKNNKKKVIAISLCVGAAILAVILGGWFWHTQSPAYKVGRGVLRLAREAKELENPLFKKVGANEFGRMYATQGVQADTKMNVTMDTFLGEITLGVDTDYAKDMAAREMSSSTALSLRNYEFGHVELYGDDENFCFSVPELFLENLYIENENVSGQYNRSLWAELFGPAEQEELSIKLFPDLWFMEDEEGAGNAFLQRYAAQIAECRRHMTIEKAGKDLYRVSFDELYFNELVRQILYDYVDFTSLGREEAMGILSYFNVISVPDEVSFLFEIDGRNRIGSIRVEEPLPLCQGKMSFYGEVYFLGENRGIERMQGKIHVKKELEKQTQEAEIVWQTVQSMELENYRMEADLKCSFTEDGKKRNVRVGGDLQCDGRNNSFDSELSVKLPDEELSVRLDGGLSHIVQGSSFNLELDEFLLSENEEELVKVKGDIRLSPLTRRVQQNVKPKTAFFEMTDREWNAVGERLYREYGYLLDALYGSMWY